jgi:rod shape-determining protein MreD
VNVLDAIKTAALLFVAAIVQVSILNSVTILGGTPDFLLVTLVGVALLGGSVLGAAGGFLAGLIVDTATLETLGVTSLLLTLAGYWVGRYGETTGRERRYAPLLSVGVVTILYAFAALLLRFMLGESASARTVLLDALPPSLLLNLLLAVPVFVFCRWIFGLGRTVERVREVRLIE